MTRPERLKNDIRELWSEDPEVKRRAAEDLYKLVSEMEDIRAAQPALTLCLKDPDAAVRRAALLTVEYRAELGADIGMAVPALESLLGDPDEQLQEVAWRALGYADQRMKGILAVVETCRPEFVFGRSTRTTLCPSDDPGTDINPLTDAWGSEPYATEQARELFARLFSGADLDRHIDDALSRPDAFNEIRAAAYVLEVFGMPRTWPGNPSKLPRLIEQAILRLKSMIDTTIGDPDCEFLERWNNDEEIVISVERQISALTARRLE